MVVSAAVRGQYEHLFTSFCSENTLHGLSNANKPSNTPISVRQPRYSCCPRDAPAAEEPLSTRRRLFPDLLRLARLAARIAQLAKLLLYSSDQAGASADSIGLGCSSVEACRDKGEMVGGEGVAAWRRLDPGTGPGRPALRPYGVRRGAAAAAGGMPRCRPTRVHCLATCERVRV